MPNDEWITPPEVMELVHKVFLQGIGLDPASTANANKIVKARRFFTKEDDGGLVRPWGRTTVWLNPPYSRGLIGRFVDKLIGSRCSEALVLVNSATDTKWFHKLLTNAQAMCFVRGRIKFLSFDLMPSRAPRYANVFFYFGRYPSRFNKVFSKEGVVVEKRP